MSKSLSSPIVNDHSLSFSAGLVRIKKTTHISLFIYQNIDLGIKYYDAQASACTNSDKNTLAALISKNQSSGSDGTLLNIRKYGDISAISLITGKAGCSNTVNTMAQYRSINVNRRLIINNQC